MASSISHGISVNGAINESIAAWKPRYNRWAIAMVVTIATFMEVLDGSIASIALPHIAGSFAATQSESAWVLTSYLVSNAIVLPISAWLSMILGRKRFYMLSVTIFMVSSIACGLASSLTLLICFRVIQGAGGGGLAPSELGILADTFPPESGRSIAFALYGLAVIVAPAIGPTLGGWITQTYNWRWIFFINVPAAILSLCLTWVMIDDPPYLAEQRKMALSESNGVDIPGFLLVVAFVAPLQILLDRGQEENWFASTLILSLAIISLIALVGLIVWELSQTHPIVNLRLFASRTYAVANLMMFALGFVLYGSVVILPQFLQDLVRYSPTAAGMVLSPGGLAMMAAMPIAGFLVMRVDARWLIAAGFALSALALYHTMSIGLNLNYHSFVMLRVYQDATLASLFVPITTIAYAGVSEGQNDDVSAMINLSRNVGGSFGIALMFTLIARRTQLHQALLGQHITLYDSKVRFALSSMASLFPHSGSYVSNYPEAAVASLYQTVQAQASTMAYIDAYGVLALVCVILAPMVLLMKKNDPSRGIAIH